MRFAKRILLYILLFVSTCFAQQKTPNVAGATRVNSKISRATELAIPPKEAFASVLDTYRASINNEETQAIRVVRPGVANARAEYVPPAAARSGKLVGEKTYKAEVVSSSLASLKGDILSKVPANDAPLRHYLEARFPATPVGKEGFVSEAEMHTVNDQVEGVVMELRNADGYTLDLKVTSPNTERARFSCHAEYPPDASDEDPVFTDSTIQAMWRGPYLYKVEKKGYWTVTDKFNTISQKGDTLECHLVLSSQPEGGECVLK